jgi:HSP20 family protein
MTLLNTHTRGFASLINRDLGSLLGAVPAAAATAFIPPVDVREEDDRFVVEADLPGVAPADIEITADKGVLTLRGERKAEKRDSRAGYERIERVSGSFTRRFTLPDNAQAEQIRARFNHGVLELTIPKQAVAQPHRVQVEAA